jgi:hypothetical protein
VDFAFTIPQRRIMPASVRTVNGTPAEAEQEDAVAGIVDARELPVELPDVPAEPNAKGAAEELQRLEALRTDPVVVHGQLRLELGVRLVPGQVDGLEELEDVRPASP